MNQAIRTLALILFLGFAAFQIRLLVAHTDALADELARDSVGGLATFQSSAAGLQDVFQEVHSIELETQRTEAETAGLLNQTRHSMLTAPEKAKLLGKANAILDDADAAVKETNLDLAKVGGDLDSADRVLADSDAFVGTAQVSVGRLDEALVPVAESMQKLDVTMTDVQGVAKDTHAMSTDAAAFVHRELAPVRGVKNTLKASLDWAYKLKQLIF